MSKDWSNVVYREELPAAAYTVSPTGQTHPIFYGRGVGSVISASVEPTHDEAYPAIMTVKLVLRVGEPVPWESLKRMMFAHGNRLYDEFPERAVIDEIARGSGDVMD